MRGVIVAMASPHVRQEVSRGVAGVTPTSRTSRKWSAAAGPRRPPRRSRKFADRCRFPTSSFVVPMRRQLGRLKTRRQTMRVMVFAKTTENSKMDGPPTPEALEAFAAMDRFTEELVKAGV